ncbi:RDD family protein [Neolewinella antarctica]|uniref:RDD family membrane protein YckC n=1 Tax=Neolewinella antarctica TaxID=442734 RepID=A0ABX0XD42_9BACT|nr:RDD family protein [Neolewinella antarctica]NJC26839.1 putative RDD family membrane protein YckC [Neolewinella antarctica]
MTTDTLDFDATRTDASVRFAGFGVRLGATVIDYLVLLPFIGAVTYFTMFSPNFSMLALTSILSLLYKPVMEGIYGATVGKMATKIKVVAKENEPITLSQSFLRAAPWLVAGIVGLYFNYLIFQIPGIENADGFMEYGLIVAEHQAEQGTSLNTILQQSIAWLPLVSALVMLGNKRKQAAHDLLAETYVVYKDPAPGSLM